MGEFRDSHRLGQELDSQHRQPRGLLAELLRQQMEMETGVEIWTETLHCL